ncbi:phosphate-starvation-inducible PsiE family protein [Mariniphaga sp.]|uniref:phosphate-starvation-inducible PsiE family protein n=1 Tax=Mariniphaga sp. TaxID=1954475 RepID=UPI0035684A38
MKKFARYIEKGIIYVLIVMMSIILILATVELGYYLIRNIVQSDYLLMDLDDLMDLFGVFLLVLIGIELLDTIKVYLKQNQVHVEVVVLVAIIALARKIVILKVEELDGETIIGIGVLIIALSIAYYLIKKAGLMVCNFDDDEGTPKPEPPEKINPL